MRDVRFTYRYFILMAAAVLMAGCGDTDRLAVDEPVDEVVSFSGEMRGKDVVSKAGADDDESEWLDMRYDTWKWNNSEGVEVPIDFVIHQKFVDANSGSSGNHSAVYQLKPGETNRLECLKEYTPLNWKSINATHKFHAWTEPKGVAMNGSQVSGTVDMKNGNLDYEYFVGTTTDELSYGEHGLTVALKFKHLISKLTISGVKLIYSDGIPTENMMDRVGVISFPNMPTTGTFNTGVGDGEMGVTLIEDAGKGKGVSFILGGNDAYSQYIKDRSIPLYLLPMSFVNPDSNDDEYGEFYVDFLHPKDGTRRYYGNLKDLVNENDPGNFLTGIKAGECLDIKLVLKDDAVDGFYAYVENWADADPETVKDNPDPGIFTVGDLVANVNDKGSKVFALNPKEDIIYGETEDDRKIIRIYDNLDLSAYKDIVVKIIVPEGYVLDGLGHNISGIPGLQFEGEVRNLYVDGISWESKNTY